MASKTLLVSLFQFKADMNQETLTALSACEELSTPRRASALRVLHHAHTVDQIFAANLQGIGHEFRSSWNAEPPSLIALAQAVRETDQWYLDYVTGITPEQLAEVVGFVFTDGGHGRMSREEMLAHVVTTAAIIGEKLPASSRKSSRHRCATCSLVICTAASQPGESWHERVMDPVLVALSLMKEALTLIGEPGLAPISQHLSLG